MITCNAEFNQPQSQRTRSYNGTNIYRSIQLRQQVNHSTPIAPVHHLATAFSRPRPFRLRCTSLFCHLRLSNRAFSIRVSASMRPAHVCNTDKSTTHASCRVTYFPASSIIMHITHAPHASSATSSRQRFTTYTLARTSTSPYALSEHNPP